MSSVLCLLFSDAMRVSVVIPVYNEEAALPLVLRELPREHAQEVIVVDNGSTDRTFQVAQAAHVKVVHESRRGYGQACQAGLRIIAGDSDVIVFLDGDHSDYPDDLPKLLEPIRRNDADLVIGSRVLGEALPGALTPQQRVGNWLACRLMGLRFGRSLTDLGPFRAIRRDRLQALSLREPTFGWNVEMQMKALKAGLWVVEVPVRYRSRIGRSKISGTLSGTLRAGFKILLTLARHWF